MTNASSLTTLIVFCAIQLWALTVVAQRDVTYFSLQEALENPDEVIRLDLSYQDLKVLPSSIGQLTKLKRLKLSHNQLKKLPEELFLLEDLRRLHLDDNQLKKLPTEFYGFAKLKKLYLQNNKLKDVSNDVGQLKMLRRLELSGNNLSTMPDSISVLPELKYLNFDKNLFDNLSAHLDSFWMKQDYLNWYRIDDKFDSIGGRPMQFYLDHPQIDELSKSIFNDYEVLFKSDFKDLDFLDSIFSSNKEILPFYLYMYDELRDIVNDFNSDLFNDQLSDVCDNAKRDFIDDPCVYLNVLKSKDQYTKEYQCQWFIANLSQKELDTVLTNLDLNCSNLTQSESELYYEYLNDFLPNDLTFGRINVELEEDSSFHFDRSLKLIVINPEGKILPDYRNRYSNRKISEGKSGPYSFFLIPLDDYQKDKVRHNLSAQSGTPFIPSESIRIWQLDTILEVGKSPLTIKVPERVFVMDSSVMSSLAVATAISSTYAGSYGYGYGDPLTTVPLNFTWNIPTIYSDEYDCFVEDIYEPAIEDKGVADDQTVPAENLALLEELMRSLDHNPFVDESSEPESESDYVHAMYKVTYKTGGQHASLFRDERVYNYFTYSNWVEDQKEDEEEFYRDFVGESYYVYNIEKSEPTKHAVSKYDDFKDACNIRDTYPLYATDSTHKLRPAFAFKHKIELEYGSFKVIDSLLVENNQHTGGYCDDDSPLSTFARLKGVPNIFFAASDVHDQEGDWDSYYPGRGIYMLTKTGELVELWNYYIEHVECSCI